jgi:CubicO group peptidase (beta-lactamase class C family)
MVILLSCCSVFTGTGYAGQPPVSKQNTSLSSQVDTLFAPWNTPTSPGCALAVIQKGRTLYKRGYGMADLEHNIPITRETVFYIGSTSKQFVAMCILLLEEQGKLSLDDDIRDYLPKFPEYDRPITIRHLIHHTSGIRDYLTLWNLAGKDYLDYMPEQAVYDMICRQKELNFSPGEQYLYSNSCYFLLALIVKKASGQTLREYTRDNIFHPLYMFQTHFHDDIHYIIKNRAFGYTRTENGQFGNLHMRFSLVGSGGLYTTIEDLFIWDQNFYRNRLGSRDPALIEKMHVNGRLNNGEDLDYAFALRNGRYRGLKTVEHGGALGGYRAQLLRFPEQQFSIIILSNLDSFNPTDMAYRVADIYLEDQMAPQEKIEEENIQERKEISLDPSLLDKYAGRYELGPGILIDITREDDNVMAEVTGRPKIRVFPESETRFFAKDIDAQITFQIGADSMVTGLILHQSGQDRPAEKLDKITLTMDQMEEYICDYYSEELQTTYHIFLEGEQLFLRIGYNPRRKMKIIRADEFEAGFRMQFQRDEESAITGFIVDTERVRNLRFDLDLND